jgi:hypothetical protein
MNLDIAFYDRIAEDKLSNIEKSIACYHAALQVWTKDAAPLDWTRTQMNLGVAIGDRITGDLSSNIKESIDCCRASLEVFIKATTPNDWASTQVNLGDALRRQLDVDMSGIVSNLLSAIARRLMYGRRPWRHSAGRMSK